MRSGVLVAVVVAGVVACFCAVVTTMLLAPTPLERPVAAAPMKASMSETLEPGLLALLDEQARELELLRARIEELEGRPPESIGPLRLPIESMVEKGVPLAQARPAALSSGELPATFVADVDAALQQIRDEERREAEAQRYEAQLEGIDRRLEKLAERIGLSGYQVDEMRDLLRKQAATAYELKQRREETEDKKLYKEQRKALEKETKAALATILTPEQLEDYQRIERKSKSKAVPSSDQLRNYERVRKLRQQGGDRSKD